MIGTLAHAGERAGMQVVISTGDKDITQLVTPQVMLVNTMTNEVLDVAGVRLDLAAHTAARGDRILDLTRTERLLLELFLRNPERVLTREVILDRVWGMDARTSSNGVEVYVGYLRRKLEDEGGSRLIETVRGVGYVLRPSR